MRYSTTLRQYFFEWDSPLWAIQEDYGKGCPDIASLFPVAQYSSPTGSNSRQYFQLVPCHTKWGISFTAVEVTGFIHGISPNSWVMGSGAPVGAFLRELSYKKLADTISCNCPIEILLAQGCQCGAFTVELGDS